MSRLFSAHRLGMLLAAPCVFLLLAAPSAARPAATEPTTAELSLASLDFPGGSAKVSKQQYVKAAAPATSTYSRSFKSGTRVGGTFLLMFESEVSLYPTAALAAKDVQEFRQALSTKAGRAAFGGFIASGFRKESKLKLNRVAVSQPVSLGAGQSSVHVSTTFVLANKRNLAIHMALVQTDRALAMLVAMPLGPRFPKADLRALAQLQSSRLQRSFTVANVGVPTVTGTVAPAQTLTVSTGDWRGAPSTYSYQWSRCDSSATTCTDIPGATSPTYVVALEDTGWVLRATVVARNSIGSASAVAPVTAPVA